MAQFFTVLQTAAHWLAWVLGSVGLLVTVLPILRQTAWWIRICDFPRLQIVAGLLLSLGLALVLPAPRSFGHSFFVASLAVAIVYQISRIWPYTPLHRKQVADASRPATDNDHHFSLMVATC